MERCVMEIPLTEYDPISGTEFNAVVCNAPADVLCEHCGYLCVGCASEPNCCTVSGKHEVLGMIAHA